MREEDGMAYKAKVHRQENVGTIGVPCLGCGLDIDRHDYLMVQAPIGVYLLHVDCATLLSEGIDAALKEGILPLISADQQQLMALRETQEKAWRQETVGFATGSDEYILVDDD